MSETKKEFNQYALIIPGLKNYEPTAKSERIKGSIESVLAGETQKNESLTITGFRDGSDLNRLRYGFVFAATPEAADRIQEETGVEPELQKGGGHARIRGTRGGPR